MTRPLAPELTATTLAALLVLLPACPLCPEGELAPLDGTLPLQPEQSRQFRFTYDGELYSEPGHCSAHWYVNDVEGGNATLGTVDGCGVYVAPAIAPAGQVMLSAARYRPGECADCCPYAQFRLTFATAALR